jgi:hypothetical protein
LRPFTLLCLTYLVRLIWRAVWCVTSSMKGAARRTLALLGEVRDEDLEAAHPRLAAGCLRRNLKFTGLTQNLGQL